MLFFANNILMVYSVFRIYTFFSLSEKYHKTVIFRNYNMPIEKTELGSTWKRGKALNSSKKITEFISAALAFSVLASGCSASDSGSTADSTPNSSSLSEDSEESKKSSPLSTANSKKAAVYSADLSDIFSERDLSGEYYSSVTDIKLGGNSVSINGGGAECSGDCISITGEGTFVVSGTLSSGNIVVNSPGKVQIVLDNADITSPDTAPIYVEAADKVFITLADGTENSLSDNSSYTYSDTSQNEPDAVIFSRDSLTLNGSGVLNISANYNEGITSKDDIVIAGCTLRINSVGNGIKGKDYVAVTEADISIQSQADGIKSTNIDDESMGFVYIKDGNIDITAQEDGIQSDTEIIAENGTINIVSGGGSEDAPEKQNNDFGRGGGMRERSEATAEAESPSTKGIKSAGLIYISGGTFNIDSADDALHSNGAITIIGGEISAKSGDDGIHADSKVNIEDGSIVISRSYEGIESADITVSGGSVDITSSDDGFNASDGTSQGAMGTYSDVSLTISGGTVIIDAGGDGLDSNGDMTISGGTILVNGPTNDGNGALDGNAEIICTGGLLIAVGSSGMAEAPSDSSSQNSVSASLDSTQSPGTLITLCDKDGGEILSFAPSKSFSHAVISSPEIESGKSYTLYIGGTSSSSESHGLYKTGGYNGDGSEAGSFTAESPTSYIGSQGMMGGGFHGGFGGGGHNGFEEPPELPDGEMPDFPDGKDFGGGMKPPSNENGEPKMPGNPGKFSEN